jgi:hypothetical protein
MSAHFNSVGAKKQAQTRGWQAAAAQVAVRLLENKGGNETNAPALAYGILDGGVERLARAAAEGREAPCAEC